MRAKPLILVALLLGVACFPAGSRALGAMELSGQSLGESFAGSGALPGAEGSTGTGAADAAPTDAQSPESTLFTEGSRAINEARWADAVKLYASVAALHGEHADGALYWKAYAQDKLGQSKPSEATCAELRNGYPKSRWLDDCSALEIEIGSKTGKKVQIEPGQSDDVKLLALNAMMRQDEPQALAEIQAILNGDSSEKLKKEAEFILGHHYSNTTYAQIVRISYVEGDVRIQRGEPNGKASIGTWEKAVADLPLETGFSLVTGEGRAEIEFEDASTLYLGENSVLTCNDLHVTAGIPYTELALLSGTVSLHIRPYLAGERFILHTTVNDVISKFPEKAYARVESFTDAMTITPMPGGELRMPGLPRDEIVAVHTWTYGLDRPFIPEEQGGEEVSTAWDKWDTWVNDRVAQRDAAVARVMEASGLTQPIPGMADMDGQGKFFDCAPYGTCWEPMEDAAEDQEATQTPENEHYGFGKPAGHKSGFVLASFNVSGSPAQAAQSSPAARPQITEHEVYFPCPPSAIRYRTMKDPITDKVTVIDRRLVPGLGYDWAVCHAGTWIRHKRHYVWVAGGKRHHLPPVRWVKSDHKVGFVPLHPYDVKGRPAINAKHEVFTINGKNEIKLVPVKFEPGSPIEFLKEPPREFRNSPMRPLAVAEVPRMEAHPFEKAPSDRSGSKSIELSRAAVPIRFDAKSRSFLVAKTEMREGRTATVSVPMTNRGGTLQAHGGTFSGGSGFHGGSSGSAGGGSHGGGGSSGGSSGGGGSHGGGGGGSVSSASSSSSSSSAASSGGGSSHH